VKFLKFEVENLIKIMLGIDIIGLLNHDGIWILMVISNFKAEAPP
jgi:hypothetical protein